MTTVQMIGLTVTVVVTGLALWKGGPPEKVAGFGMLVATFATPFFNDRSWLNPQYAVMGIDILMFALLATLALASDRWWPMFAAAFQLLVVIFHLAFLAQPDLMSRAYIIGLNGGGYFVLAALATGVWVHWRRGRPP